MNTKKEIGYFNMNKKYNNIIFINEIIEEQGHDEGEEE